MNRPLRSALAVAPLMLLLGCRHLAQTPGPPQTPPVASNEIPPPPAADTSTPPEPNLDVPAGSGNGTPPACTCADAKAKPKPKPRPKPVHQEVAPQPPVQPPSPKASPTDVVNAQVRPTSVSVTSILGKRVDSPRGEDLGRVVDVLADADGRVRIAIIDFGGFLGVGARRIAVEWPLLRFSPDHRDSSLVLSVTRERLRTAPEYKDDGW